MFSDDEILGMVNQARASSFQGAAPTGTSAAGFDIPPELKEKFKNILMGLFRLIFAEFMSVSAVHQQGLQRGPGPGEAVVLPMPPTALPSARPKVHPPDVAPDATKS